MSTQKSASRLVIGTAFHQLVLQPGVKRLRHRAVAYAIKTDMEISCTSYVPESDIELSAVRKRVGQLNFTIRIRV